MSNDKDAVVVLCLNHHRLQTVDQRAAGIDLDSREDQSVPERVVALLRGLALMFADLAKTCRDMADRLTAFVGGLDANSPGWRNPPEVEE